MFPQPQPGFYHDGFNEYLFAAVPSSARRILEVGCARGRLGHELKRQDPGRYVAGVELDSTAAEAARARLDDVFVLDVQDDLPPVEPGSLDCLVLGDVLEHLVDPEAVLRRYRELLRPEGLVLVSVPNIQHFSIIKNLLRGDFMYQPSGLLDATHLRFFTYMTFAKLMLDAGFLPRIEHRIRSGEAQYLVEPAAPLLQHCRVHPDAALEPLDTYQYVVSASLLPDPSAGFAAEPITFVACVNDDDQLESNLLRSPCLDPGTPHELILMRGQTSAADGFNKALETVRHDLVVFVQQDMYLPRGWDSQFVAQFRDAERQLGPVGVAGVFGYRFGPDGKDNLGRVLDRQALHDARAPLPTTADGLDEIVLAVPGRRRCGSTPASASTSTAPTSASAPASRAYPWSCSTPPACTTHSSCTCRRSSTAPASSCWPSGPTSGPCTAAWAGSTPWSRSRSRAPGPTSCASVRPGWRASWPGCGPSWTTGAGTSPTWRRACSGGSGTSPTGSCGAREGPVRPSRGPRGRRWPGSRRPRRPPRTGGRRRSRHWRGRGRPRRRRRCP